MNFFILRLICISTPIILWNSIMTLIFFCSFFFLHYVGVQSNNARWIWNLCDKLFASNEFWAIYWGLSLPWRLRQSLTQRDATLIPKRTFKLFDVHNALLCRKCLTFPWSEIKFWLIWKKKKSKLKSPFLFNRSICNQGWHGKDQSYLSILYNIF